MSKVAELVIKMSDLKITGNTRMKALDYIPDNMTDPRREINADLMLSMLNSSKDEADFILKLKEMERPM